MQHDESGGLLDRRIFLQLLGAAAGPFGIVAWPLPARAQIGSPALYATLTASQRMLLDGPIYKEIKPYLAYADVVRQNIRGNEAVAKYDAALQRMSTWTPQNQIREFEKAITDRILIDCLVASPNQRQVSFQQLLAPALPRLGISATIFRQVDTEIGGPARQIENGADLLRSIQSISLLPSVPSEIARGYARDNLAQFAGDSGLAGLIAISMRELARSNPRAAEIQTALLQTTTSIKGLADGIGALRSSGPAGAQQFAAMAGQLAGAVEALGRATSMNPQTVQKISKGVKVAGAMLSGAAAGATLGPYGAAAGAVVGLLGSLFGGGGDGPDPTLQALSQLDARISRLQRDMAIGFQQIGQHLAALSQQMQEGFTALSTQIQRFEREVQQNFATVVTLIRGVNETLLQARIDGLVNAAREHEILYRRHKIAGGEYPFGSQSNSRVKTNEFLDTIRSQGRGFSGPAFVGTKDFEAYLTTFSRELASQPLAARWRLLDNFTGGLPRLPRPFFQPNLPPSTPPITPTLLLIETEVDALARRLRDDRYGAPGDRDGAGIIGGIHQACYLALAGIETSDEWRAIEQRPEQKYFIPAPRAPCPPAAAPQDLWGLLSTAQQATTEVSDLEVVQDILKSCLPVLKEHLKAHYLLTGQNSLPALLYVQRRLAAKLADDASTVFCNPFMAAVDVLRRVINTRLSAQAQYRPAHSTFQLGSLPQAQSLIRNYRRSHMPLANAGRADFPAVTPEVKLVEGEIEKLFRNAQIDPRVPASPIPWTYLEVAAKYEINNFATRLPDVMRTIDGRGSGSPLTSRLMSIRANCFALGVVERCIAIRLDCLKLVEEDRPPPKFDRWFGGFQEYGMIAAYALAQERRNIPNVDPEFDIASAVIGALLDPLSTNLGAPVVPAGLPAEANPYPNNYGFFWGWGAEGLRPNTPAPPALAAALVRPECAFAGENGAIMGAVQVYSELQSTFELLNGQSDFLDLVQRQFPRGVGEQLREQLRGA